MWRSAPREPPVTTEDDFHATLDARPDDWLTRLVLADFLQERDDPRVEGYRVPAVLRLRPHAATSHWWSNEADKDWSAHNGFNLLPADWFALTTPCTESKACHCDFDTRREAEDAAAFAFAELPAPRRSELLAARPAEQAAE